MERSAENFAYVLQRVCMCRVGSKRSLKQCTSGVYDECVDESIKYRVIWKYLMWS
jgi:hypothetical protein